MKALLMAVALSMTPTGLEPDCYCPFGHETDEEYWETHAPWPELPPMEWWRLYLPRQEGRDQQLTSIRSNV